MGNYKVMDLKVFSGCDAITAMVMLSVHLFF